MPAADARRARTAARACIGLATVQWCAVIHTAGLPIGDSRAVVEAGSDNLSMAQGARPQGAQRYERGPNAYRQAGAEALGPS